MPIPHTSLPVTPLGRLIISLCKDRKIAIAELGRRVGYSPRSVHARMSQIIRTANLQTDTVIALARGLGIDPVVLFAAVAEGSGRTNS